MVTVRFVVVLLVMFIFVSGCNVFQTEKDDVLYKQLTEFRDQVENEEWRQAMVHLREFQERYEQRKWKLQLLGELEDYKDIEKEIEQLKESVQEEDAFECKLGLSEIKHNLDTIYQL